MHDALKRRCLYQWIEYPSFEKEMAIVRARVPGASARLAEQMTRLVQSLRRQELYKVPGVSETIDWVTALVALDRQALDPDAVNETLGRRAQDERRPRVRARRDDCQAREPGDGAGVKHVALLRAVNLAGHNKIGMADLKALLVGLGFEDAQTLLQSGNVVFSGGSKTTSMRWSRRSSARRRSSSDSRRISSCARRRSGRRSLTRTRFRARRRTTRVISSR